MTRPPQILFLAANEASLSQEQELPVSVLSNASKHSGCHSWHSFGNSSQKTNTVDLICIHEHSRHHNIEQKSCVLPWRPGLGFSIKLISSGDPEILETGLRSASSVGQSIQITTSQGALDFYTGMWDIFPIISPEAAAPTWSTSAASRFWTTVTT